MDPYITFFMQHWLLSVTFIVVAILLLANEWRQRAFGVAGIEVQQLVDLLNHDGAVVVDIRPVARFEAGHILGATHIVQAEIANRVNTLNKFKTKPIIVVCQQGLEAPKVGRTLQTSGFTSVSFLAGGMDRWQGQGMPVVKK